MRNSTEGAIAIDPSIDKEALRQRYARERDKRLRPDGTDQYQRLDGKFGDLAADPWTPVEQRVAVTDHVTFTFIGGGFAGLCAGAHMKMAGVDDVRIIDTAGGFGGVWYWNRYPGIMCDTKSAVYLPLLDETGYIPRKKWAYGPEILEHAQRIATQYALHDRALLHTRVTRVTWQEEASNWLVETDRGDRFTTQFLGMGLGPLCVPKLPGVPGIERFTGKSMHTSRWDYDYTGGSPEGDPLGGLRDKRVGVIGTGATAVQLIPEVAKHAKDLYVFQRTPSSVGARGNGPLDEEVERILEQPDGQKQLLDSFTLNWDGMIGQPTPDVEVEDLIHDGWTELASQMRDQLHTVPPEDMSVDTLMAAAEDLDMTIMEQRRARVDDIVDDPDTAEKLKAWYKLFCKRPCFHDEYLSAFNRPNVHLVDTDGQGVEQVTPNGVVVAGEECPLDCIIYASGFEFGTGGTEFVNRTGYDVIGRGGMTLADAWADGTESLHGMHVHGFPNMFIVQIFQGSFLGANVTHGNNHAARTIASVVSKVLAEGNHAVEVTKEAQDAYVEMLLKHGMPFGSSECTPGYYNDDGQPYGRTYQLNCGYPQGSHAFINMVDEWCRAGEFPELDRR